MDKYSSTEDQLKEERRLLSIVLGEQDFSHDDKDIIEFEVIASGLSQQWNEQRNVDIKALEKREKDEIDELKRELKEEKKEEMDELERKLKEEKKEEMENLKNLAAQGIFVLIGCSVTCVAAYLFMRRG
jgi:uncharacterized membrane protein (DUF106 family)